MRHFEMYTNVPGKYVLYCQKKKQNKLVLCVLN